MMRTFFSIKNFIPQTIMILFLMTLFCATGGAAGSKDQLAQPVDDSYFEIRGALDNCRIKFINDKQGRVVYLGGSITTMKGWRDHTYDMLKQAFPDTKFDFINAGIGGTNSTLGAFRFEDDVFKNGPVDLLFLEYAVNDGGGNSPNNRRIRAMEGIIRHARRLNSRIDIVMQYFVTQDYVKQINQGKIPPSIIEHEKVAQYYNIPIINLAQEMTRRINQKEFVWEDFSKDSCHPSPFGHQVYAVCIDAFLKKVWAEPIGQSASLQNYQLPKPLDKLNYEHGRFVEAGQAKILQGWRYVIGWKAEKTCNYSGPVNVFAAEHPADELQIEFIGTLIGISAIAGMDAGVIEYSIDNQKSKELDLFDNYCARFHRPVCHILAENLKPGEHTLKVKMMEKKNPESVGHAARILKWVVN
jgi:lysophospholipase L1-like esterase